MGCYFNPLLEMWSVTVSKHLYHISEMLGTFCHLNVAARAGKLPAKEVFKGQKLSLVTYQNLLYIVLFPVCFICCIKFVLKGH
jgi:hypothetical protein